MNLNIRADIHIIGGMMIILAATFLLPMLIGLITRELRCAGAFYLMFILVLAAGFITRRLTRDTKEKLRVRDGFFVVASTWLLFPLLGAFPYLISGSVNSYSDAFFEACSGFTTTGATIFDSIDALPTSIVFWRSFTQWLGGFGVLALSSSLIPWLNRNRQHITTADPSAQEKADHVSQATTMIISSFYIGLTLLMILIMLLSGCSLFDSVCHAFSTLSTGGFCNSDMGLASFSKGLLILTMVFMFLAGTNYNLYIRMTKHGPATFLYNMEFRTYFILMGILVLIILIFNTYTTNASGEIIEDSIFQVISFMTTTGYVTSSCNSWPDISKALLVMILLIGGCMGSTSGGIKINRAIILFKLIRRSIGIRLHPNAIIKIRIAGKGISNDAVIKATSFFYLYISLIIVGSLLVALDNQDFITTISSTIGCIGNAGPLFSLAGATCTYSMFSGFSKLVLSFLMIAGRLELFTFLAIFTPLFWDPNR